MLNNGFEIRIGFSFHCLSSILYLFRWIAHSFWIFHHQHFFSCVVSLTLSTDSISAMANAIFRFFGLVSMFPFAFLILRLKCFCLILVCMREHSNSSEIEYFRFLVNWNLVFVTKPKGTRKIYVFFLVCVPVTMYVSALHEKAVFFHSDKHSTQYVIVQKYMHLIFTLFFISLGIRFSIGSPIMILTNG